jgi:hypothetical protein
LDFRNSCFVGSSSLARSVCHLPSCISRPHILKLRTVTARISLLIGTHDSLQLSESTSLRPNPNLHLLFSPIPSCSSSRVPATRFLTRRRPVILTSPLSQATVLRMGAVCRRWRQFVRDPAVWRALCLAAWPGDPAAMSQTANQWGGWKSMLFSRPRLMTEGVYVQ